MTCWAHPSIAFVDSRTPASESDTAFSWAEVDSAAFATSGALVATSTRWALTDCHRSCSATRPSSLIQRQVSRWLPSSGRGSAPGRHLSSSSRPEWQPPATQSSSRRQPPARVSGRRRPGQHLRLQEPSRRLRMLRGQDDPGRPRWPSPSPPLSPPDQTPKSPTRTGPSALEAESVPEKLPLNYTRDLMKSRDTSD